MAEDQAGFGIVPRYLRGKLKANEIALYVALSWRADPRGVSWASQKVLAEDAGMSRATVQRSLDSLAAHGLVKAVAWANSKGRTSNVYVLKIWGGGMPDLSTLDRPDGHPIEPRTQPDLQEPSEGVPTMGTDLGTDVPTMGERAYQPSNEGGVPQSDAHPRLTVMQRKKNHKNETQTPPPRSVASLPPSSSGGSKPDREEVAERIKAKGSKAMALQDWYDALNSGFWSRKWSDDPDMGEAPADLRYQHKTWLPDLGQVQAMASGKYPRLLEYKILDRVGGLYLKWAKSTSQSPTSSGFAGAVSRYYDLACAWVDNAQTRQSRATWNF